MVGLEPERDSLHIQQRIASLLERCRLGLEGKVYRRGIHSFALAFRTLMARFHLLATTASNGLSKPPRGGRQHVIEYSRIEYNLEEMGI